MPNHSQFTRRNVLKAGALVAMGAGLGMFGRRPAFGQTLPPTPACADGDAATLRQTEGPFYKPLSPERADLREAGFKGRPVELSGFVVSRSCRPVQRALVDLWQADGEGVYDNSGYRGRGHVYTDARGFYRFLTAMPALYPGRTRHYHVKVQAPGRPVLTTQLYFPNEAENRRDRIFRQDLVMRVAEAGDALAARFDFVVDMS